jgi:ketosteroid isomerase-like protein
MAQNNVEIVKSAYAAFGRGDIATILATLAPDVEWTQEGPAIVPYSGKFVGPDQVAKFFAGIATTQTGHKLTIDHILGEGDIVATSGRYAATVTATGKSFDIAIAHFFHFQDGKMVRFVDYGDTAAVAEAYTATASAAH